MVENMANPYQRIMSLKYVFLTQLGIKCSNKLIVYLKEYEFEDQDLLKNYILHNHQGAVTEYEINTAVVLGKSSAGVEQNVIF